MRLKLAALVALIALSTGCAASLAQFTSQAITDNEKLHCGAPGAPVPPLCLTDAQFQKVAAALNTMSVAGLAYTQVVEAAHQAGKQPPADAVITMVVAVSNAMAEIQQAVGPDAWTTLGGDLKKALGKL